MLQFYVAFSLTTFLKLTLSFNNDDINSNYQIIIIINIIIELFFVVLLQYD